MSHQIVQHSLRHEVAHPFGWLAHIMHGKPWCNEFTERLIPNFPKRYERPCGLPCPHAGRARQL